jgi:hypothetical protein
MVLGASPPHQSPPTSEGLERKVILVLKYQVRIPFSLHGVFSSTISHSFAG